MSTDYALRKFNNRTDYMGAPGQHIIDVDCVYESGKFIMKSLPANLPELFTIRFTAPADYSSGDAVAINDRELPVHTPGMVNATAGLFVTGAVLHCDIDLGREIAFFWQSGGGTGGVTPNLSLDEQFAGFYDLDGSKVYVKTFEIPLFKGGSSPTYKTYPHNIANLKRVVDLKAIWNGYAGNRTNHADYVLFEAHQDSIGVIIKVYDLSPHTATVTLYYTCSGR